MFTRPNQRSQFPNAIRMRSFPRESSHPIRSTTENAGFMFIPIDASGKRRAVRLRLVTYIITSHSLQPVRSCRIVSPRIGRVRPTFESCCRAHRRLIQCGRRGVVVGGVCTLIRRATGAAITSRCAGPKPDRRRSQPGSARTRRNKSTTLLGHRHATSTHTRTHSHAQSGDKLFVAAREHHFRSSRVINGY